MKIDVVCLTKRANYDRPIVVIYETIRVPSYVKTLDRETVEGILKERVQRIRKLGEYWKNKLTVNMNQPFIDDHSDRVLISWSPIITTEALEFICQNF